MTVFELRQYRTRPGQRESWVKYMEEVIIPFQTQRGMTILGSFVGEQEDDLYVWVRRFDSEEDRQRLYRDVYESDEWKNTIAPPIPDMMDRERIVITRLTPTPRSSMK
jgi:NIPSNAP